MSESDERWLMFSFWRSYLKEDYMEVGLDVTGVENVIRDDGTVRQSRECLVANPLSQSVAVLLIVQPPSLSESSLVLE